MERGVTRRTVLRGAAGAMAGVLAGCATRAEPAGEWPTFGYDVTNTGVAPEAPGPSRPKKRWRTGVDRIVASSPAVATGVVYVSTLEGTVYALG